MTYLPHIVVLCTTAAALYGAFRWGHSWGFDAGMRYGLERGATLPRPQKHWGIEPQ